MRPKKLTMLITVTFISSASFAQLYSPNGTNPITNGSTYKVGVGTSNPETSLHVKSGSSELNPTNVGGLFVENSGAHNSWYVFQTATKGGGKSFSITNAGNVGIGTSIPASKLDIYADETMHWGMRAIAPANAWNAQGGAFKDVSFLEEGNEGNEIFFKTNLVNQGWSGMSKEGDMGIFYADHLNGSYKNHTSGFVLAPAFAGGKGLRMGENGQVGIWTRDVPEGYALAVAGKARVEELSVSDDIVNISTSVESAPFTQTKTAELKLFNSSIVASSYSAPQVGKQALQIGIGNNQFIKLNTRNVAAQGYSESIQFKTGEGSISLSSKEENSVTLSGNKLILNPTTLDIDVQELNLNSTLFIGDRQNIENPNGTWTTNYKLAVDGSIICEKIRCEMSEDWADYVFGDNYSLKPLEEVKSYIQENKHLPGLPSAQTIANEGLDLVDMQRLQMEKIEELTLYMIQLKEENEALKKDIIQLKQDSSNE